MLQLLSVNIGWQLSGTKSQHHKNILGGGGEKMLANRSKKLINKNFPYKNYKTIFF